MSDKLYMIVFELDDKNQHLRYIRFPVDAGKDFCYRSRVSFNWFFKGPKQRNYKPNKANPIRKYAVHDDCDWTQSLLCADTPAIEVDNIWEFYEHIGYDYKRQKWL